MARDPARMNQGKNMAAVRRPDQPLVPPDRLAHRWRHDRIVAGGKGEVRLLLPVDEAGQEMELVLPGRYDVSPTQRGALSVLPGVLAVMDI